jgi:hypothetical protein
MLAGDAPSDAHPTISIERPFVSAEARAFAIDVLMDLSRMLCPHCANGMELVEQKEDPRFLGWCHPKSAPRRMKVRGDEVHFVSTTYLSCKALELRRRAISLERSR